MTDKRRSVAAILGLTLIVAACSGGSGTSAAPSAAESAAAPSADASAAPSAAASGAAGDADLSIWADDKRAAALKPLAAQFGDGATGVTVQGRGDLEGPHPNFKTASAGRAPAPDIVDLGARRRRRPRRQRRDRPDPAVGHLGVRPARDQGHDLRRPALRHPVLGREHRACSGTPTWSPDVPTTMEDLVATGKKLVADGKANEIMSLQVGQAGDAYHIYPLFASGGGSFFGTTADGRSRSRRT